MPRFRFRLLPETDKYTPVERLLRLLALMLVFGVVVWAFWKQNEKIIARLENRQTVSDTAGYLNERQRSFIKGFRDGLKERYGLDFKLKIVKGELREPPQTDSKTFFLLLAPESHRLLMRMPPILSSALGKKFLDELQQNHLETFWQQDDWQDELIIVLASVWERLDSLGATKGG
ncbi:hypothetical protein dsx2_2055 [Desulfovibrio sp. X2]|uniref:hypothetical protein n=1 Tax=Desulfovibrio sp. X2 TaxID=941449 RepID=UPI000358C428|nr:hypothetical protein [Desulfovibrio sp. X2]EPR43881.1 hypothetical protein dsx2_2055 [Desulfovibrio sp. X2]